MATTRNELHEAIDRLNEEQTEQVLALVPQLLAHKPDPLWECLKTIPGLTLPDHWPPQFAEFEPLQVEVELTLAGMGPEIDALHDREFGPLPRPEKFWQHSAAQIPRQRKRPC